jgi:hypothetical protein
LGLDFSHGRNFAKDVKAKLGRQVHASPRSAHFLMVVSFRRATFHLDEELVALALEAVLGVFVVILKFLYSETESSLYVFLARMWVSI